MSDDEEFNFQPNITLNKKINLKYIKHRNEALLKFEKLISGLSNCGIDGEITYYEWKRLQRELHFENYKEDLKRKKEES